MVNLRPVVPVKTTGTGLGWDVVRLVSSGSVANTWSRTHQKVSGGVGVGGDCIAFDEAVSIVGSFRRLAGLLD
jgi:hypothetical protein